MGSAQLLNIGLLISGVSGAVMFIVLGSSTGAAIPVSFFGLALLAKLIKTPRLAFYIVLASLVVAPILLNFVSSEMGFFLRETPLLLTYLFVILAFLTMGKVRVANFRAGSVEALLIFMFLYMLFEAIRQQPVMVGLLGFRSVMYYSPIFFLTVFLFNTRERLHRLIRILILLSMTLVVISILQHIFTQMVMGALGFSEGGIAYRTTSGHLKASATLGDASAFGAVITITIGILLCLKMSQQWERSKSIPYVILFLLFGVILSFSRANYLALLAISFFLAFFYKSVILKYYLVAGLFLIIFNAALDNILVDNMLSILALGGSKLGIKSTLARLDIIEKGLDWFAQSPVIGHGLGVTGSSSMHYAHVLPVGYFVTDNYFLKLLIESGIVGAALFSLFLFFSLNRGIKNYKKIQDTYLKHLCLGAIFGVLVIILNNLTNSNLESSVINSFLWILVGIITSTGRIDRTNID